MFEKKREKAGLENITVISKGVTLSSKVELGESICHFRGKLLPGETSSIESKTKLVVESGAEIHGDIKVKELTVKGKVVGNIETEYTEILEGGEVLGDIKTVKVTIIDGVFNGNMVRKEEKEGSKNNKEIKEGLKIDSKKIAGDKKQ